MDTERLHRLADEADAEHRAAMRAFEDHAVVRASDASPEVAADRRRFIRRLSFGAGAALASIPLVARAAAAQGATTTVQPGDAGPPPPDAPSTEDKVILGWAQSVELAIVSTYRAAVDSGKLSADLTPTVTLFAEHHEQYAQAHASLAGKAALNTANPAIVAKYEPVVEGANNQTELLQTLHELELAAASTYVAALGELVGTDGSLLVASILPIEARHAAVFADALGLPPGDASPALLTADDALTPAEFPLTAGQEP